MAEPYLGEIRLFAFDYAPRGWAFCDGSILSIAQNNALYAIIGTTYGGDGKTTFKLPDLRGRTPVHVGDNNITLGKKEGEENHTLALTEMPLHIHQAMASSETATSQAAAGKVWANSNQNPYGIGAPNVKANTAPALASSGTSEAHKNMQPFTVVNYCIALMGIFPPRS